MNPSKRYRKIYAFWGDLRVTVSIGIADYADKGLSHRDRSALLRATDEALYQAKRGGKNQTVVWEKSESGGERAGERTRPSS